MRPDLSSAAALRIASEEAAISMASRGVRVSVVRLAPSVHGDGKAGFVSVLIGIAREKGVSAYVGDGINRWPAVHRLDAARLFRLALEKGPVGARFHGVADEGVPVRDIAQVIGRRLNVPVVAKSPADAAEHFGWFAHFAAIDSPGLKHANSGAAGMASNPSSANFRPRRRRLFPNLKRVRRLVLPASPGGIACPGAYLYPAGLNTRSASGALSPGGTRGCRSWRSGRRPRRKRRRSRTTRGRRPRNSTTLAISSGLPSLPSGIASLKLVGEAWCLARRRQHRRIDRPGANAITRTP